MYKHKLSILSFKDKMSNMKKAIFIILLIVVFAIVVVFINSKKEETGDGPEGREFQQKDNVGTGTPTPTPTPTPIPEASITPAPVGRVFDIVISNEGLLNQNLVISAGDTVRFLNNSDAPYLPASGIHPTHQICPGLNSPTSLKKGESFSFTFSEAKECPFHNHLDAGNAALKGKITVTE